MAEPKPKRWKQYELKVAAALEATWPEAVISHDQKLVGRSGGKVQVDALVDLPDATEFVIVDAKDRKRRVDRGELDRLWGAVDETGAKSGAIFSNSGFTDVAIASAKRRGLRLYSLVDSTDDLIRCVLSIEAIHTFTWVEQMTPRFSIVGAEFDIGAPPAEILIDQVPTESVLNVFAHMWNSRALSVEPGEQEEVIDRFFSLSVPTRGLAIQPTDDITFRYTVKREQYLSQLPITSAYGVYDVSAGLFTSIGEEVAFGVSLEDIVKNGRRIGSSPPPAVQVLGSAIHVIDA